MTYTEREQVYNSSNVLPRVKVALCDWMNYWAVNGTDSIEDGTLKAKTEEFIRLGVEDPWKYAERISVIMMGSPTIKEASEITDLMIKTELDTVMSTAMDYIM